MTSFLQQSPAPTSFVGTGKYIYIILFLLTFYVKYRLIDKNVWKGTD